MSGYLTGRALWADLPIHLKLTLICVTDACNEDGIGYFSHARMAGQLRVSDRQVRKNLAALRRDRWIDWEIRGGDGTGRLVNRYFVNVEKLPFPPTRKRKRNSTSGCPDEATGTPAQGNRNSSAGLPEPQSSDSTFVVTSACNALSGEARPGESQSEIQTVESPRDIARRVLAFLNEKTGRNFRPVEANLDKIIARFKEGADEATCRKVIVIQARKWAKREDMAEYLRPMTLFARENFWNYAGEIKPVQLERKTG